MCESKFYIIKCNINSSNFSSEPSFTIQIHLALSMLMDRGAEWWGW